MQHRLEPVTFLPQPLSSLDDPGWAPSIRICEVRACERMPMEAIEGDGVPKSEVTDGCESPNVVSSNQTQDIWKSSKPCSWPHF